MRRHQTGTPVSSPIALVSRSRHRSRFSRATALACAALLSLAATALAAEKTLAWRAGAAAAIITPTEPMALAGYAQRNHASTGVMHELSAKALALEHTAGGRLVVITMDAHMVPRELREHLMREAGARHGLKPEELLVNASHTHCGPELRTDPRFFANAGPQLRESAVRYRASLEKRLAELVAEAIGRMAPANVEQSLAHAGFAMNRRRPAADGRIALAAHPYGPVDHDVPVLKVTGAGGKLIAVLFNYACHNTTFGGNEYGINGDFAGFAQTNLEATFPGATALFLQGCAGDQDPQPRVNSVPDQPAAELARQHGRTLSNAVTSALSAGLVPVRGPIKSGYGYADLPFQILQREDIEQRIARERLPAVVDHMRGVLTQIENGSIARTHAWPVQVVKFGPDLTLVALGGEAVVDYGLRIKRELRGPARIWVAGYSNDGYRYLGTRRVIEEGGYEGLTANLRMMNNPGPFDPSAEEIVMAKVHELHRLIESR